MDKKATVYVRSNSTECRKLIDLLDESNVDYDIKNVTEEPENLKQLQEHGVFSTPASFIGDTVVLGYQENKLKQTLGMHQQSHNCRME